MLMTMLMGMGMSSTSNQPQKENKMIKEKREYLKNQIGFHSEDLTHKRQLELSALTLPNDFVYVALGRKPLDYWNEYGFGLMFREDFANEVNAILKAIEEEDDAKFIQNEQPKTSTAFVRREQTISAKALSRYPDEAFSWLDEERVISNITNTTFRVIGGKKWFEEYIEIYGRTIGYTKNKRGTWDIIRH